MRTLLNDGSFLLMGNTVLPILLFQQVCGGGGGPVNNNQAQVQTQVSSPASGYMVSGTISGMNGVRGIGLRLNDELLTVDSNGTFVFEGQLSEGTEYKAEIERESARQDCEITNGEGTIADEAVSNVRIVCSDEESAPLFSLDRMHRVRLTITVEEWNALILDTLRSNYSVNTASGPAWSGNSWSHSEVYRQADFEYLDDQDGVITLVEKVAFKMQGNTSRQFPIDNSENDAGTGPAKPKRFSFAVKFDEEFDDDESVYSCIDNNGHPAAVSGFPCLGIVGQDIPEYPEADGREFMNVEKLRFRYNRDDPSYQREVLAHDILNQIGVPAARAAHTAVEFVITGGPGQTLFGLPLPQTYNMGVFIMVEQIDKPFLKSYFDKNGYLFKVGAPGNLSGYRAVNSGCDPYENSDLYFNENFCAIGIEKPDPETREEWLGTVNYMDTDFVNTAINWEGASGNVSQFVPYKPTYDLKTKKKSIFDARAALIDFAEFVQSRPTATLLAERFDVPGFIRAQAAEIVLGSVDHYVRVANNYYLYYNEPSSKWIYIPTDFDFTLIDIPSIDCNANPENWECNTGFLDFRTFRDVIQTYAFPYLEFPHWAGRPFYPNGPPLLWNLVFSSDSNRTLLYQELQAILDNQFNWYGSLSTLLIDRDARVSTKILSTDAGIPGNDCELVYNPSEIDGDQSEFCNEAKASIKTFIEEREAILQQEISRQIH